jgi:hypothetical protein|tara:strand:+ start:87 stop:1088 length:1002 start_codon:yes stop_codon:yes gene_type:complete
MNQVIQRAGLRVVATIDYKANQVVREHIPISGKVRSFYLRLKGTQTHTNVTAVQQINGNPGTLVKNLNFYLNRDEVYKSGKWSDWIRRMGVYGRASASTAVGNTVAAFPFNSAIRVMCQTPGSKFREDTLLNMDGRESGGWDRLDIEIDFGAEAQVCTATATSFAVAPQIEVLADIVNTDRNPNGLFRETAFETDSLGTAANTEKAIELTTGPTRNYHSIILVAENDPGAAGRLPVSDMITSVRLQQTAAFGQSNLAGLYSGDLLQEEAADFAAYNAGIQTGVYPILFQPRYDGQSTFNVITQDLDDLRLLVNHAGFANAGYIRVLEQLVEPL